MSYKQIENISNVGELWMYIEVFFFFKKKKLVSKEKRPYLEKNRDYAMLSNRGSKIVEYSIVFSVYIWLLSENMLKSKKFEWRNTL